MAERYDLQWEEEENEAELPPLGLLERVGAFIRKDPAVYNRKEKTPQEEADKALGPKLVLSHFDTQPDYGVPEMLRKDLGPLKSPVDAAFEKGKLKKLVPGDGLPTIEEQEAALEKQRRKEGLDPGKRVAAYMREKPEQFQTTQAPMLSPSDQIERNAEQRQNVLKTVPKESPIRPSDEPDIVGDGSELPEMPNLGKFSVAQESTKTRKTPGVQPAMAKGPGQVRPSFQPGPSKAVQGRDWEAELAQAQKAGREPTGAATMRAIESFTGNWFGKPDHGLSDAMAASGKEPVREFEQKFKVAQVQKQKDAEARKLEEQERSANALRAYAASQLGVEPAEIANVPGPTVMELLKDKRANAAFDARKRLDDLRAAELEHKASGGITEIEKSKQRYYDARAGKAELERDMLQKGGGLTAAQAREEKLERSDAAEMERQLEPVAGYARQWKDLETLTGPTFLRGDEKDFVKKYPWSPVSLPASNWPFANQLVSDDIKTTAQKVSKLIIDARHEVFGASLSPGEKASWQEMIDNSVSQGPRALANALNTVRRELGTKLRLKLVGLYNRNPDEAKAFVAQSGMGELLDTFGDVVFDQNFPREILMGPSGGQASAPPAPQGNTAPQGNVPALADIVAKKGPAPEGKVYVLRNGQLGTTSAPKPGDVVLQ